MAKKEHEVGVSFSLDKKIKEELVSIGKNKDLNFFTSIKKSLFPIRNKQIVYLF